jgi:hypothetical protein
LYDSNVLQSLRKFRNFGKEPSYIFVCQVDYEFENDLLLIFDYEKTEIFFVCLLEGNRLQSLAITRTPHQCDRDWVRKQENIKCLSCRRWLFKTMTAAISFYLLPPAAISQQGIISEVILAGIISTGIRVLRRRFDQSVNVRT